MIFFFFGGGQKEQQNRFEGGRKGSGRGGEGTKKTGFWGMGGGEKEQQNRFIYFGPHDSRVSRFNLKQFEVNLA